MPITFWAKVLASFFWNHILNLGLGAGLGWAGWRGWPGLGWAGLGWAGLGWPGAGWVGNPETEIGLFENESEI